MGRCGSSGGDLKVFAVLRFGGGEISECALDLADHLILCKVEPGPGVGAGAGLDQVLSAVRDDERLLHPLDDA